MAFPTTGLLDAFTGTNGDDLNVYSANWAAPPTGANSLEIQDNASTASANLAYAANMWATTYGPDVEIYAPIDTLPASGVPIMLLARGQQDTSMGTIDGYALYYQPGSLRISRIDNGALTDLVTAAITLAAGDLIGLEIIGSTLKAYRFTTSWAEVLSTTDNTYSAAGTIGLYSYGNVVRIGALFGGTVVPSATPPTIDTDPVSQTGNVGGTTTFSCTASSHGGTGLAYQWEVYNGTSWANVGTNSASYTTPSLAAGMDGYQYRVTVTDSAGSDTSAVATLTVLSTWPTLSALGELAFGEIEGETPGAPVTSTAAAGEQAPAGSAAASKTAVGSGAGESIGAALLVAARIGMAAVAGAIGFSGACVAGPVSLAVSTSAAGEVSGGSAGAAGKLAGYAAAGSGAVSGGSSAFKIALAGQGGELGPTAVGVAGKIGSQAAAGDVGAAGTVASIKQGAAVAGAQAGALGLVVAGPVLPNVFTTVAAADAGPAGAVAAAKLGASAIAGNGGAASIAGDTKIGAAAAASAGGSLGVCTSAKSGAAAGSGEQAGGAAGDAGKLMAHAAIGDASAWGGSAAQALTSVPPVIGAARSTPVVQRGVRPTPTSALRPTARQTSRRR